MGQVLALADLISAQHVWRGQPLAAPESDEPTGLRELDMRLPTGGWPEGSLTEVLVGADGTGELDLLVPTLARLTQVNKLVALIAPPYVPYAPAWQSRGVVLRQLHVIEAEPKLASWAMEQCLRSGTFAAVLAWPKNVDHHALRRLQVAAMTGHTLGFAFRDKKCGENPSPAPLRLEIDAQRAVLVRKCRGGVPPQRAFAIPAHE